jgi:hypothetical protein
LAVVFLTVGRAQTSDTPKPGDLEFRIEAEDGKDGLPQSFTFVLTNRSSHDIRIPTPAVQCFNSYNGYFQLFLEFTPAQPGGDGEGQGCGSGLYDWPSIAERVKKWKIVQAGETLQVKAGREQVFLTEHRPGTYDFWATYQIPSIAPADQKELEAMGIDFPRRVLQSNHLRFVKRR